MAAVTDIGQWRTDPDSEAVAAAGMRMMLPQPEPVSAWSQEGILIQGEASSWNR